MTKHQGGSYYYGSYGIIRGYGPLYQSYEDADDSVFADNRAQRRHGGTSDRNPVAVSKDTGLCWWWTEEDARDGVMLPVKTPSGAQAQYSMVIIRNYEGLWGGPMMMAGFF